MNIIIFGIYIFILFVCTTAKQSIKRNDSELHRLGLPDISFQRKNVQVRVLHNQTKETRRSVHKHQVSKVRKHNANVNKLLNMVQTKYLRFSEAMLFLKRVATAFPTIVSIDTLGKTFEGNAIKEVKLSSSPQNAKQKKPVIFLECGMHAREWLSPALCLLLIILAAMNPNLIAKSDWHVVPITNPDGYEYSHIKDRFWRKNRHKFDSGCYGVDGNRNFDIDFGGAGISSNPCSEIYGGPAAFSDAESRAIRTATTRLKGRINTYLAIHSYGPSFLYPYGYSKSVSTPNGKAMNKCAQVGKDTLLKSASINSVAGNTAKTLYPSAGGSDDWVLAALKVPFAYTIELMGGGKQGFDLPEKELSSALQKTLPSILALISCTESNI